MQNIAVLIFFILSGFLITYSTLRKKTFARNYSIFNYFIDRFTRIYVAFIPADFTFGESELKYFNSKNTVLGDYSIGSRAHKNSFSESSFDRKIITTGFNFLKKTILNLNIKDTMGTFIIETNLAKKLSSESFSEQFFITTEFIFRAIKEGIEIDEIPIINKIDENNQTTVRYFYDSYDAFVDILKLRKLEGKLKY